METLQNLFTPKNDNGESTLLDIVLGLEEFFRQNKDLCTLIRKQTTYNSPHKINWGKTVSRQAPLFCRGSIVYVTTSNSGKIINYEDELLCIYFSTLRYIAAKFDPGMKVDVPYLLAPDNTFFRQTEQGIISKQLRALKGNYFSDNLQKLVEAGATSFKIEGRLKDVAYVKNVTASYSERLNEIIRQHPDQYCRASKGTCEYTFKPDLNRTFNRGYTTYFLNGRKPDIASFDTPKAVGAFVGKVKEIRGNSFNVAGVSSFANGDGLCFLNEERKFEGLRANRVEGNRIYPFKMPHNLRPGMALYRNNDQEFERLLEKPSATRKIPVSIALRAVDDGFELSAGDVTVHFAAEHQLAQKSPHENLIRQLSKWGDTIYACMAVDVPDDFNYFIPNSQLSEMRRQLIAELSKEETPLLTEDDRSFTEQSSAKGGAVKYPYPYLYNIANRLSQQFYGAASLTAYELKGGDGPIMQCRHCIRYSLGYCVKHDGNRPSWHEPLSLVLGDGRRFRLEFDCQHCQMNVYAEVR
jgi:putative protease